MTTGQLIRKFRKLAHLTQKELAEKVHKSPQVISNWERGYTTSMAPEDMKRIALALNISSAALIEQDAANTTITTPPHKPPYSEKFVRIPLLGRVVAGIPMDMDDEKLGTIEIPESMSRGGEYFGLKIRGDSMQPTLHDGDIVVVRRQPRVENGEIAIVTLNGNEATAKEVKDTGDGIMLIGHNVAVYAPTFYSAQEVEEMPLRVIGKVVELRRKL